MPRLVCLVPSNGIPSSLKALLVASCALVATAFVPQGTHTKRPFLSSSLFVSVGLGPGEEKKAAVDVLTPPIEYEIPDHEEYRLSRRSKIDEQCDAWFESLMEGDKGIFGSLADDAEKALTAKVELVNEVEQPRDSEDYTPYLNTRLPWTPLTPSYGVEAFGIPVPRRNAETWRHFDVPGMVATDYAGETTSSAIDSLTDEQVADWTTRLKEKGGWLGDDFCSARLVYVNGNFVPQLSKTSEIARNLDNLEGLSDEVLGYLSRLTDGFTDELAVPCSNGEIMQTSQKHLSAPNHCLGEPTSQMAINTQQGTACFAALNTVKAGSVAYVHAPANYQSDLAEDEKPLPVLIVNAVTKSGGAASERGVTCHPRALLVAEESSLLSVVQSCVDLDLEEEENRPKLYNGYTQVFVKKAANMTHSYLEESGGMVTGAVELSDDAFSEGEPKAREVEAQRPELKDTHLEAIDAHVMGEDASYEGTVMSLGGSGRIRLALSVTLLQPGAHAGVNGFSLSGGAQRTDVKTNIHHIAQGTTSRQIQKNLIGGRATGAFRGRIRVEQSAQQTDSQQLSRSILLSDKARAWSVPSLEIIADDVQCTHGATVSDLSEEELFYLRSRGLGQAMARNLLMYAFAGDVAACVDPAMLGTVDSAEGLQQRAVRRLENLVPRGERAIRGDFQSV